ncbi:MAG: DUF4230 domain-containing protein [Duncaniella sp.]|nr:DUF4230 domain-containing protein [Duncaniella sp.]
MNTPSGKRKNAFAIVSALLLALLTASCGKDPAPNFYEEIRSVDNMVFASMAITKTARIDDSSGEWYKIGKRIAVYSYDTYLEAYIDLSQLKPEDVVVDEKNRTVSITLPPVQTELAGRDMTLRREYDNVGKFRSPIDARERALLKEKANESLKAELAENPRFRNQLVEQARRRAEAYFSALCEAAGYKAHISFRPLYNDR